MITTDISIVLYGFDTDDFAPTLHDLQVSAGRIRRLWILLSGSRTEYECLINQLHKYGLEKQAIVVHRYDNLGFASGHNYLLRKAFLDGARSCLVLNPDVRFSPASLKQLVASLDEFGHALFGPTLARAEPGASNTVPVESDSLGIGWTRNGRHFDLGQGEPWKNRPSMPVPVQGVTGACLMVPVAPYDLLHEKSGYFFDDAFIAYREDAELGIRAAAVGVPQWILPVDGFDHVRTTRGFTRKNDLVNLLGVRNRYLIKWSLGPLRPGSNVASVSRDLIVMLAVLLHERSSIPGIKEAFRMRRYALNRGKAWRRNVTAAEHKDSR